MIKFFAYGSLVKGSKYHQYYLEGQTFLGKGSVGGYKRYIFGGLHGIHPEQEEHVQGEVYEIDAKALHKLEFMYSSNFSKETVEVEMEDGPNLQASTFVWNGHLCH